MQTSHGSNLQPLCYSIKKSKKLSRPVKLAERISILQSATYENCTTGYRAPGNVFINGNHSAMGPVGSHCGIVVLELETTAYMPAGAWGAGRQ